MVKNKYSFLLLTVLLVSILSACSPGSGGGATPTPLPPVVNYQQSIFKVERGPIVAEKTLMAEIVPSKQDDLYFRASGYVNRVTVKQGNVLKKGDVLAEMQIDDL